MENVHCSLLIPYYLLQWSGLYSEKKNHGLNSNGDNIHFVKFDN